VNKIKIEGCFSIIQDYLLDVSVKLREHVLKLFNLLNTE